ncbi:unnamed protein product, partial [Schistosoma mattheei]
LSSIIKNPCFTDRLHRPWIIISGFVLDSKISKCNLIAQTSSPISSVN